ncbi:MAG TPA: hypothetical protein VIZ22_03300 [Candidatus Limnocylindrales bacterium]
MPEAALLWLGLLVAVLLGLFLVTARRMSKLIARTRDLEAFQRAIADLDASLGTVVDPLVTQLDEIRRRAGDPVSLSRGLDAIQGHLRELVGRGRELRPPRALADDATAMLAELDRASRATDLLEHGLDALLAHRGHRELEAQTSLKRAALNLRNARGAAASIARRVAAVRPADLLTMPDGKETVRVKAPSSIGFDGLDGDDDLVQHPRM